MKNRRRGVPKGGRENYLERQSRGRGRVDKAARTLWRIAPNLYNRYAIGSQSKNLSKNTFHRPDAHNNCTQQDTATVYLQKHLIRLRGLPQTTFPSSGWPDLRSSEGYAAQLPWDLWTGKASHRHPRRSQQYQDAPTQLHQRTLSKRLQL